MQAPPRGGAWCVGAHPGAPRPPGLCRQHIEKIDRIMAAARSRRASGRLRRPLDNDPRTNKAQSALSSRKLGDRQWRSASNAIGAGTPKPPMRFPTNTRARAIATCRPTSWSFRVAGTATTIPPHTTRRLRSSRFLGARARRLPARRTSCATRHVSRRDDAHTESPGRRHRMSSRAWPRDKSGASPPV